MFSSQVINTFITCSPHTESGEKWQPYVCFWQQQQKKKGVFSMNSDNHHDWTKPLFRPNSLYPDVSRLCPDPFQMACRVHLKCVSSDQFWWDLASLLTCDFICGDTGCCKTEEKTSSDKTTTVAIWCFQFDFKMFSESCIGKSAVLKFCHLYAHCTTKLNVSPFSSAVGEFTLHYLRIWMCNLWQQCRD